ncbi:flagellar hook-basal body protein [Alicyclobacillus fodiniaquatilis]|uniref:Flagellar hook-basal body protein n=1 Tax=Alicyclobacillus fodiniaquatilis TaxID=1661150 RepID=A0ABW4JQE9_9BACL
MANPLLTAVSGMDAFQSWMNVIGNDIANVNTVGYKASEVNFANTLSQVMSSGSAGSTTGIGGTNPIQIGTGVQLNQVTPNFTQGGSDNTGNSSDLMISGNGLFALGATTTSPTPTEYTRAGNFTVDSSGYLVAPNGDYLLASTTPGGTPDTAIDVGSNSYTIGQDGTITVNDGNTPPPTYYLSLANFPNPSGLTNAGTNMWTAPAGGNQGAVTYGQPGTGSIGTVQQGYLESSNVDLTQEMSNMIQASTDYDGSSKLINTVQSMYQYMLQQV